MSIKSGLRYLDEVVLGGGLPTSSVTEIQGLPSSWRSSVCKAFWKANPGSAYFNQESPLESHQAALRTTSVFVSNWHKLALPAPLLIVDGTDSIISHEEEMWDGVTYPSFKRGYDLHEFYKALRMFAVQNHAAVLVTANLFQQEVTGFCWTETKESAREHISTSIRCSSAGKIKDSSGQPIGEYVRFSPLRSTILDVQDEFVPEVERGIYGEGLDPVWSRFIYLIRSSEQLTLSHGYVYTTKEERLLGRTSNYREIVRSWDESL